MYQGHLRMVIGTLKFFKKREKFRNLTLADSSGASARLAGPGWRTFNCNSRYMLVSMLMSVMNVCSE